LTVGQSHLALFSPAPRLYARVARAANGGRGILIGMSDDDGLVFAYALDGQGGARHVGWPEIEAWQAGEGTLWIHLDRGSARAQQWLNGPSGLQQLVVRALLAHETRPRTVVLPTGLLVILRGANLNPGERPEDMVSLRTWAASDRVITVRRRRLKAERDVVLSLESGLGPLGAGGLLVGLVEHLAERMAPVIERLDSAVDHLEVAGLAEAAETVRPEIAAARRRIIAMRRYIAPQRDALNGLITAPTPILSDADRMRLRECVDRVIRYIENLDSMRERAAVTNDELSARLAEGINRRMYLLAVVAAVFLPLGLLTGLLGVNVGGIPGQGNERAFWIVTVLLVALGTGMLWMLRSRRLF
jgi:zinc transporter